MTECSNWEAPYTSAGLQALLESPHLRRLAEVRADGWQLTEEERGRLRSRYGRRLRLDPP